MFVFVSFGFLALRSVLSFFIRCDASPDAQGGRLRRCLLMGGMCFDTVLYNHSYHEVKRTSTLL